MKFYVASRFGNYLHARAVIDNLKALGHECTCDWTRTWEFDAGGKLALNPQYDLTPLQQHEFAVCDLVGVLDADVVILLYTDDMCGAYIEVGIALGYGRKVDLVGQKRWTIFWALPNVRHFQSVEDMLAAYAS